MAEYAKRLTCIHAVKGLCDTCQADYDTDPAAYIEFGDHPQGIANWKAEQARIEEWNAAQPQAPSDMDDTSIPF